MGCVRSDDNDNNRTLTVSYQTIRAGLAKPVTSLDLIS